MTSADLAAHWTARLHDLAAEEDVQGAALGVWADGQETAAAHGVLNAATGVEATPDSLFQIGSITKVWTTTMIMQLIDEGRLSLDSTVAEVLPGVRLGREDASAEVRISHLLTHRSGIDGDIFTDTGRGDDCVERYVGQLEQAARIFPPGAAYSYCNSGFVLLGRIIEVLDGREWDASLRARLAGPLGLSRTVTLPEEAILHRVAAGHRAAPLQDQPVSVWGLPRSVGPAGLITASVHDVLTFARLHVDGGVTPDGTRLLSQASAAAMQQPRAQIPSLGRDEAIGLGWRLNRWGGRRIFGHDGGTIGQTAYLRIDQEARVAACLLTNSPDSRSAFERLFSEIFRTYAGVTVPACRSQRPGRRTWTWPWSGTPAGTSAPRGSTTYPSATGGCTCSPARPATGRPSVTTGRTSSTCTPRTARATTSSAGCSTGSRGPRWSSAGSATRRPTSTSAAGLRPGSGNRAGHRRRLSAGSGRRTRRLPGRPARSRTPHPGRRRPAGRRPPATAGPQRRDPHRGWARHPGGSGS